MNSYICLVKRARSGEAQAFAEIVQENKKKIFYLAYYLTGSPQDAEDLSQEVFFKAFRKESKKWGQAKNS